MNRRHRKAVIVCNGEHPSRTLLSRVAGSRSLLIVVDGAANSFPRSFRKPNVIIGDLDSISRAARKRFSTSRIVRVGRQDNTDLEKALDYCVHEGVGEIAILGATGKRIDHTLGNLCVVWKYTKVLRVSMQGDEWSAFFVERHFDYKAPRGTTVSLIPYSRSEGITLRGLKYPLKNAQMGHGEIGVSNVVVKSPFGVKLRRGRMLVLVMKNVK